MNRDEESGEGHMVQDVRKLTESFIRFSVRMDEQTKAILTNLQKLDNRFCEMERVNGDHDKTIASNAQRLDRVEGTVEEIETDVEAMRPWVGGLRWAVTIGGAIVVTAAVGALIWALVQSGAGVP